MSSPRAIPLAYFLSFTCYGTWLHGRAPGSVDRAHNEFGTPFLPPDAGQMANRQDKLPEPPFTLDQPRRQVVLATVEEVSRYRGWHLFAAHVRTNHVHLVARGEADPDKMLDDYKAYASRRLKEANLDPARRKRWTQGGSTRYLWTPGHLERAVRYVVLEQGQPMEWFVAEEYAALVSGEQSPQR